METGKKKKKKKKKNMLMTSLSQRETIPAPENGSCGNKGSTVGCIAGIFHFLSLRHHSNSRKRLPSATRKNKPAVSNLLKETPPLPPPPNLLRKTALQDKEIESTAQYSRNALIPGKAFSAKETRRHSCEVQRSPTLPTEIRRLSSVELSLDSPRRPSPLVVRLMGLDEIPVSSPDSAAEKRRKLLGALEKCDEDLKSLKRIIDAVIVTDKRRKTVEEVVESLQREEGKGGDRTKGKRDRYGDIEDGDSSVRSVDAISVGEQPSPVSVLQFVSSPRTCDSDRLKNEKQNMSAISSVHQRSPEHSDQLCTSGDGDDKNKQYSKRSHPSTIYDHITFDRVPSTPKRNERELSEELGWVKKPAAETSGGRWGRRIRSHALVESVGEVWEAGVWEERRERRRVCVGVEKGLFGDLVDEIVGEMLGCDYSNIRWNTCKKRLCF